VSAQLELRLRQNARPASDFSIGPIETQVISALAPTARSLS
jgi:hypothetical protein